LGGAYAYSGNTSIGLFIVDVADPFGPFVTSLRNTPGEVFEIDVIGSYAYVADGPSGFKVMDITDPSQAVDVAVEILGTRAAHSIALSGNRAYLLETDEPLYRPDLGPWPAPTNPGKLYIFDISDPTSVTGVGVQYDVSLKARSIAASGSYVFVVDETTGLEIIDVSREGAPFTVATAPAADATDIEVHGRYAYITSFSGTFRIIDLLAGT
jgi:hypothetical protein